jgi:hypothetical protein
MQASAYASLQKTESRSVVSKLLEALFCFLVFVTIVISLTHGWWGYATLAAIFAIIYELHWLFE